MDDLGKDQWAFLGNDLKAESVVGRCLDLLKECGKLGRVGWTDASLTSTNEKWCLTVTMENGTFHGYGSTKDLAAISCFKNLWFDSVEVPNAPEPNAKELSLLADGNNTAAFRSYMDRTGKGLGLARERLNL